MAGTLTWETQSDWDSAASQQGVAHPADVLSIGQFFTGIEDGNLNEWTIGAEGSTSAVTSRTYEGSYALANNSEDGTQYSEADAKRSIFANDIQVERVEIYFQETGDAFGGGFKVENNNDNDVCGWASDNPSWNYYDNNGTSSYYSGDGYNNWIKSVITFDWGAGTFDISSEDMSTGSTASSTGQPLINTTGVGKVSVWAYTGGTFGDGKRDWWWDNILASSKSATLTTATKSFGTAAKVDLKELDYTLNGESITLDVIGSPGTADEEIVSQTLDGSTEYTLSWANKHTDFRVKANLSSSSYTTSPSITSVSIKTKGVNPTVESLSTVEPAISVGYGELIAATNDVLQSTGTDASVTEDNTLGVSVSTLTLQELLDRAYEEFTVFTANETVNVNNPEITTVLVQNMSSEVLNAQTPQVAARVPSPQSVTMSEEILYSEGIGGSAGASPTDESSRGRSTISFLTDQWMADNQFLSE